MAHPPETRIDPADWDRAVAAVSGPQLVVSGPGAGKTEFLARRALWLVETEDLRPAEILILSFSRRSAADLRRRVAAGLEGSFGSIAASTFHGFAFRLLEAHRPGRSGAAPTLLTGPEQVALVRELLATEDPSRWPLVFRGLLDTGTFADEVTDFVLRCREHLLDSHDLAAAAAGRPEWRALPAFLARYRAALEERGRIDYGSLQAEAVSLLDDPGVAAEVADQFRYVLVDEYQDTTAAQAALLQRLYATHRNLTVAGDPYQSIFSFRGAELTNIADFPGQFPAHDGTPARRLVLTTSFRVPEAILDSAVRITAGGSLPGAAGPVVPAPGRGSVETYRFDQHSHEAEWIAGEVLRLHLREQIPYGRIAVLVRSKRRFLTELARALERRGIPHEEPDRRLVDHPAVRVVLDAVRAAAANGPERDAAVRRLLLGRPARLTLAAMRQVERARVSGGETWDEAIRRLVPGGGPLADIIGDPSWAVAAPAGAGFWHLWSTLPHFAADVARDERASDRAAWASLGQVLQRLNERDPAATLADYVGWSEAEDFEATPLLEYRSPTEDRLTLATLHQAKGVDFDVVFIADAVEGVLPDLRRRESLLGSRHLSPGQPEDSAGYARFRLQEEMRLAYTAMCRARLRVVWTCTVTGSEDGSGMPSRFLAPAAGVETVAAAVRLPGEPSAPTTPLEAEAWMRRLLADAAAPAPQRLAALSILTEGDPRLRPALSYAGILEPGPDTGLVPADPVLSPSQADAYLQCPRAYALGYRLHAADGGSVYQAFGSLMHRVLEAAESAALAAGDGRGTLEAALEALDGCWDPAAFGGGPWAEAWRHRAASLLEHLYERWPGDGNAALLEHHLEMEVAGTRWRGRADRIETTAGPATRIVDYKTSATAVTTEQAAASVQLGFYLLAAQRDPAVAAHGPPAGAEFWYPAAPTKGVTVRRFDPERLDEVAGRLQAAAEGIRAEDWTPQPGDHCRTCVVRRVCPARPEGREAYRG